MAQVSNGAESHSLDTGWAIKHGLIGGLIAGITFAMAEMIAGAIFKGNPFMSLYGIAGLVLQTPPDQISQGTAIIVGGLAHMIYSMMLGVIVAYIVANFPALYNSSVATVVFATVIGFIIWPLNFYVLAPILNAPWFQKEDPIQQFIWHTFMYGTVLGLYLASRLPRHNTTSGQTLSGAT